MEMKEIRKNKFTKVMGWGKPTEGGALSIYTITKVVDGVAVGQLNFQTVNPNTDGINGVTMEDILAICVDRLEGFQAGPFASINNKLALEHIKAALVALDDRTADRIERNVHGEQKQ